MKAVDTAKANGIQRIRMHKYASGSTEQLCECFCPSVLMTCFKSGCYQTRHSHKKISSSRHSFPHIFWNIHWGVSTNFFFEWFGPRKVFGATMCKCVCVCLFVICWLELTLQKWMHIMTWDQVTVIASAFTIYTYIYICTYTYKYIFIYEFIYMCVWMCIYICINICIYVSICI